VTSQAPLLSEKSIVTEKEMASVKSILSVKEEESNDIDFIDKKSSEMEKEDSIFDDEIDALSNNDIMNISNQTDLNVRSQNLDQSHNELEDLLQQYESAIRLLKSITPDLEEKLENDLEDLLSDQYDEAVSIVSGNLDEQIENEDVKELNENENVKELNENETEALKVEMKNMVRSLLSLMDLDK